MKDLVCTKCNKKLATNCDDGTAAIMQAGYCNDQTCQGKLEWRDST